MWNWLLRFTWSPGKRLGLILLVVLIMIGWAAVAIPVLQELLPPDAYRGAHDPLAPTRTLPEIMLVLIPMLLVEEVARLLPLAIVVWLGKRRPVPVMIAVFVTAGLFGAAHVSNGLPLASTLVIQGMIGLALNLVYLKCGGLHGYKFAGLTAAFTTHYVYDVVIIATALMQ